MRAYIERLRRRLDDQLGQGMTEYALIVVLIAVVVILLVALLGHQTNNLYSNISNGLTQQ